MQRYVATQNLKTPAETSWPDILKLSENHYTPLANPIVGRCKFQFWQVDHNVFSGIARVDLKCDFGEQLDTPLRDRMLCGIADDRMQRQLLSEL